MEKYENLGIIGEGSYGVVLRCKHKETGQVRHQKQISLKRKHRIWLCHVRNLPASSWTSSSSFQPCELIISRLSQSRNFWRQRMIREWRRLPWGRFACSKGSGMSILSISSRWVLSACKHTYIHMKAMLNDIDSECTLSQWKCGKYKYFQQWFHDNKTWGTLSPYLRRYLFIKYIPLGQHFVPVLPSVDFSI